MLIGISRDCLLASDSDNDCYQRQDMEVWQFLRTLRYIHCLHKAEKDFQSTGLLVLMEKTDPKRLNEKAVYQRSTS